jgi:hypothetical protein
MEVYKTKSRQRDDISLMYPSEASCVDQINRETIHGACLRALYYGIVNIPMTNTPYPSNIRKMKIGDSYANYECEQLESMGILLKKEESFEKIVSTIKIKGRVDAIINLNEEKIILEFKSSGGYAFKSEVMGTATKPGFPKMNNILQSMLYLDAFEDIHKCYLMYIDRESCMTKEFLVELNNGYPVIDGEVITYVSLEGIYMRFKELYKHLSIGTVPKRDFRPNYSVETASYEYELGKIKKYKFEQAKRDGCASDWNCEYCNYKQYCINNA